MRRFLDWTGAYFGRRSRFVFLSYPRTDFLLAAVLHRNLVAEGIRVFWDTANLELGEEFNPKLREKLNQASVIVALWTPGALERPWLRVEADAGLAQHKLIPLLYRQEPSDLPGKYAAIQTTDIATWDGKPSHPIFRELLNAIAEATRRTEDRLLQQPVRTFTKTRDIKVSRVLKFGDSLRDDNCPEVVLIPPAKQGFFLGSKPGRSVDPIADRDITKHELPATFLAVPKPLLVGKYQVTYDEWDWAVRQKGGPKHTPSDKWGRGRMPVTDVSWFDAQEYVEFLTYQTGLPYRLLTEAEWEYACRAGTRGPFAFAQMSLEIARYDARGVCAGSRAKPDLTAQDLRPVQVSTCLPNEFRLCGMHGNVWEWVQDHWHEDFEGYPHSHAGEAWLQENGNKHHRRVIRGGCYQSLPQLIRSASRSSRHPHTRSRKVGFRVAREV